MSDNYMLRLLGPGERAFSSRRIGGWVGPRIGTGCRGKEKILYSYRESKPGCTAS